MSEADEIFKRISELNVPFWERWDFWIFVVLGLLSLFVSYMAFREAKHAKTAANEAGQTVKIQTITIELSELIQKLDKLEPKIEFSGARDFYSEVNRRIRRLTAPFKSEVEYKDIIAEIIQTLEGVKDALAGVRPISGDSESDERAVVENSVYFAVEKYFSDLGGQLAELMGYFEKRTIKID